MKIGVPKIRLGSSLGIYLAESHVAWCVLEKTLFGTRERETGQEPCVKQDWAFALNRVLEKAKLSIGEAASIVIGLPASSTFFATLPHGAGKSESAENLLAGHHCCTSIPPSDLSADMLAVKVNGRTFAAIGASRRKELTVLTDVTRKLGFRFVRVEPAPWALMRVSSAIKAPKVALRLLVDGSHMIAALVCGPQPLLWRSMELAGEGSADSIVSLVRTFESYASQQLGVSGLDAIVLEGPDIKDLAARLTGDLGERFSAVEGPGPTISAIARGLAIGGLERDKPAPDLARSLAPPPRLWDLVPRGEVALLGSAVVCMGLWLWGVGTVAQNNARRVEEDNAKNPILKIEDARLKDEKKVLGNEVQAVNAFLSNRVLWTEYLSQLSGRIPHGVRFVSMQGEYEFSSPTEKNEKKIKRQLLMTFSALVPRNLSAPPEVDKLLEGVRTAPAIARDFPDVKLSSLRVAKNQDAKNVSLGDPATFMITCFPKGKDKKPGADGGGADKKDAKAAAPAK